MVEQEKIDTASEQAGEHAPQVEPAAVPVAEAKPGEQAPAPVAEVPVKTGPAAGATTAEGPASEDAPAEAPRRRARKPRAAKAEKVEVTAEDKPAASAEAPEPAAEGEAGAEKPAPKRSRKPRAAKAAKAEAAPEGAAPAEAPAPVAGEAAAPEDDAKPSRRRGRPRKAEKPVDEAPVSADVAAARALSQVSQAEVARKERAEQERAAAQVAGAGGVPAAVAALIDPSLRPHRRGRKPKAYVEAEKAAAAALAAQQAAYLAEQDAKKAAAAQAGAKAEFASEGAAPAEDAVPTDVRPGRARRKASDKEVAAVTDQALAEAAAAAAEVKPERESGEQRRSRNRRHQREDAPEQDRQGNGQDKAKEPQGKGRGNDRRERFDRKGRNNDRKNRNDRFNVPNEPSVSREELAELKVAELRERAKEHSVDYSGKKKAELVEEVYAAIARDEGFRDIEGILDIDRQGFGYIRARGYMPSRDDAFVSANMIRGNGLRAGDKVAGTLRPMRANDKLPGLSKIHAVNGRDPEEARKRPKFSDLTPIYPNEPLRMEHGRESITGRSIDILAPVGKGQRGLIVSPPKAGKTTVLKQICQSIAINNPEVHLICLLVDERPEEVTDMERSIKGDVVASTFDMPADNHTRVSELVIERAKRLVEMGEDVVVVLDSITRLARAYNLAAPASGRILSGGVDSAALYPPKRFLGAARNIEGGGSLTILASALVETGSKMDEVIFEEFKGTGNMELKLDRDLADRRVFPAIDPVASGTRNEDLLVDPQVLPFMWGIRRVLAGMNNTERAAASFIKGLKATDTNLEFLQRTAKKAGDYPEAL